MYCYILSLYCRYLKQIVHQNYPVKILLWKLPIDYESRRTDSQKEGAFTRANTVLPSMRLQGLPGQSQRPERKEELHTDGFYDPVSHMEEGCCCVLGREKSTRFWNDILGHSLASACPVITINLKTQQHNTQSMIIQGSGASVLGQASGKSPR